METHCLCIRDYVISYFGVVYVENFIGVVMKIDAI